MLLKADTAAKTSHRSVRTGESQARKWVRFEKSNPLGDERINKSTNDDVSRLLPPTT